MQIYKSMSTRDKTFTYLLLAIFILFALVLVTVYTYNTDVKLDTSKREKELRDSIHLLQSQVDSSHIRQAKLEAAYDSMLNIEPTIIYETREKIKFIYLEANATQLDSIIRTKSKRKRRYS